MDLGLTGKSCDYYGRQRGNRQGNRVAVLGRGSEGRDLCATR